MAKSLPPEFGGIDFTKFSSWEPVIIDGLQYYQVPGKPNYVFDASAGANGQIKLNPNSPAIKQAIKDKTPKQPGPYDSLIPLAGTATGLLAISKGGKILSGLAGSDTAATTATTTANTGALGAATAPTATVAATTPTATGALGATTGNGLFTPIGGDAATTVAPQASSGLLFGDSVATAPGFGGGLTSAGFGPLAAVGIGTYLGGKSAYDLLRGQSDNSLQGKVGRGLLGVATGGISEIARPFLMHKSTKDIQNDRHDALIKQGITGYVPAGAGDPTANAQFNTTRDEKYLTPDDVLGSDANFETFGNNYLGATDDAGRRKLAQDLLDKGLYQERKGGIYIDNKDLANKEAQNLGIFGAVPTTTAPAATPTQTTLPAQANTSTPGFQWIIRNGKAVKKTL